MDSCTHQEINLPGHTNWQQQPWRLVRALEGHVLFLQLLHVIRCSPGLFIVMSLTVLSFDLNNLLNYPLKPGQKSVSYVIYAWFITKEGLPISKKSKTLPGLIAFECSEVAAGTLAHSFHFNAQFQRTGKRCLHLLLIYLFNR